MAVLAAPLGAAHELDDWLVAHPAVGRHVRFGPEPPLPYSGWPADVKERLWRFFDRARSAAPLGLPDPPRNAWPFSSDDAPDAAHQLLTTDDARNLYLATVARSLQIEIDHGVPWSLDELNEEELEALLAGPSFFWWNESRGGFEPAESTDEDVLIAPPDVAARFLESEHLVGRTRADTIVALVGWCRGLTHFTGAMSLSGSEDHWDYRGAMPVSRVLAGTRRRSDGVTAHFTAGCHGTVGLLVSVLRTVNVPAYCRHVGGHATIIFPSENLALTHGDDPYNRLATAAPTAKLFVDLATYDAWLGPSRGRDANVGRRTVELGLEFPSPALREWRRDDRADGRTKEQSRVFECFRSLYSISDLERARLWERLDAADGDGDVVVLEAEDLAVSVTGGRTERQPMTEFTAAEWSGGAQRWWVEGRHKDALTVSIPVASAGRYRVAASFTRAPDYGVFEITLDGAPTQAMNLDLFDRGVTRTDFVLLGEFELAAGEHRLTATIVGKNPSAADGEMLGIDAVRLERVK